MNDNASIDTKPRREIVCDWAECIPGCDIPDCHYHHSTTYSVWERGRYLSGGYWTHERAERAVESPSGNDWGTEIDD